MTSLANAKVGDLIATPERRPNLGYVIGADTPWKIQRITAVTPANVWVGGAQIRKKDGLIIGHDGKHAQPATPEMVQQTKDATTLYLRAHLALQRIRSASDAIGRWKIYASGTPTVNEHLPRIREDIPAVDGITLDQAERLLAALDDILKPPAPAQIDATGTEPTQEESDFLSTTFAHWDFSLPGHELARQAQSVHRRLDTASSNIARALEAKGLLEVVTSDDPSAPITSIKLTAAGIQWMVEAPADPDENQERSERSDRPAG